MKKLLIGLLMLFILIAAGVAVFIATFDADRYRPLLVSELQQAVGRPVRLERISLGWQNGVAIQLKGLAVYEDDQVQGEPLVQVESISALVRLMPLLRREVQVSSVLLRRPRIHVTRDAQGQMNLLGLAAVASPAASARQPDAVGKSPLSFNIGSLVMEEGVIHWTDAMSRPPVDLWLRSLDVTVKHIAPGKPMDFDAKGALAGEAQNIRLSGRLMLPNPPHQGSIDNATLAVTELPIEQLIAPTRSGEPQLQGQLTLRVSGDVPTLEPAALTRLASGTGQITVADPVINNLNILRRVFEQLSMLPGLVERLEARLPQEYQAKLAAQDTVLSPIDLSMQLESGTLRFDQFDVHSDTFRLTGAGQVGVDGSMLIRSTLYIEPTLSAAIVRSVNELEALTNAAGEMEMPLVIQGHTSRLAVLPDLKYIASRVVTRKVVDLLEGLLQPPSDQSQPPTEGAEPSQPERDLLGTILQRALQKDRPPSETPSQ